MSRGFLVGGLWYLVEAKLKVYHVGNNRFGGLLVNVEGLVVNAHHYAMLEGRIFFYLHQTTGKYSHFE